MEKSKKKQLWLLGFKLFFVAGILLLAVYLFGDTESDIEKLNRRISETFYGKIEKKYYLNSNHIKIKEIGTIIDIDRITDSLYLKSSPGDSIIKYANSNCCTIIKKGSSMNFSFKMITKNDLSQSKYLRKIIKKDCSKMKIKWRPLSELKSN